MTQNRHSNDKEPEDSLLEREDPVWDLLGKAAPPKEASPYFASKVLRALEEEKSTSFWHVWNRQWFQSLRPLVYSGFATGTALVALFFVIGSGRIDPRENSSENPRGNPSDTPLAVAVAPTVEPAQSIAQNTITDPASESEVPDLELFAELENLIAFEENALWTNTETF